MSTHTTDGPAQMVTGPVTGTVGGAQTRTGTRDLIAGAEPEYPGPDDLLVVTPWYPTPEDPYAGGFVRQSVLALAPYYRRVVVLHVENVSEDDDRPPTWSVTAEAPVRWIGVPMDPMTARAEMMRLQGEAMRAHALDLIRSAAVVHCHVGAPTGAGLADLLAPATRLVLTEHATYLPRVLRLPEAREPYVRAVERAAVVTAVGTRTARVIEAAAPSMAAKVAVVANPLPLDTYGLRTRPSQQLSRWLFIGNLVPRKGVRRLLHAFAAWVGESEDDQARLTIVGQGLQRADLADLAEQLQVADRVHFAGAVPPDRIAEVYPEHDVLVHLSEFETFGLTCVEAAASGLAVLVTACSGPEETLAVHAALGLAEFVPVAGDTEVADVLRALHRLRDGVAVATEDDVLAARAHLDRCYGDRAVGSVLHAALTGPSDTPATTPLPRRPAEPDTSPTRGVRVLGVAVLPTHARAVERALRQVAALGGSGLYLTAQPVGTALSQTIEVVDISALERHAWPSRLERAVVLRGPGLVLRVLGRAARLVDALTRPAGPDRPRLRPRVAALQQRHRELARRLRWGPYAAFWRVVGPWYVGRRLERDGTLANLDLAGFDGMVVPDDHSVPVAVRVLRRRPELEVHRRWTGQTIARIYAERARRRPAPDAGR